jgi:NDP-sugar pyrophosphorylase family protein
MDEVRQSSKQRTQWRTVTVLYSRPIRLYAAPAMLDPLARESAIPTVAAILAGGLGTRLRSVTGELPKVLAEVGGRPFIHHLLEKLVRAGVRRVVLCAGFGADMVRERLGERYGTLRLAYSEETEPLGTGGALRLALHLLQAADPVLVLNGDSCAAADLGAFARAHQRSGAIASLVAVAVPDAGRYGALRTDAQGRIRSFAEKGGAGPGRINAGIYLIGRRLITALPAGKPLSLERDALPKWVRLGRVMAHADDGPFIDIGTPDSFARAGAVMAAIARQSP